MVTCEQDTLLSGRRLELRGPNSPPPQRRHHKRATNRCVYEWCEIPCWRGEHARTAHTQTLNRLNISPSCIGTPRLNTKSTLWFPGGSSNRMRPVSGAIVIGTGL